MSRTLTVRAALAVLLLALPGLRATAGADDAEFRDPRAYFFTPTFGDLIEEMQLARDEGKLGMLLFFEADACQYCQAMLKNVLADKQVQDWYTERFVNIAIDIHGDVELTDFDGITLPSKVFSDQRQVFLTPVVSFIDLDGNEVYRHLGMIRTPAEFLLLGEYVAGNHQYLMEFATYEKRHGLQPDGDVIVTPAGESE
jgi:thioredoxin-related protein